MSLTTGLAPTFGYLFLAGFGQGVSFTGLGVGMATGSSLAGLIAGRWGWRMVFLLVAVPSLLAGVIV